MYAPTFTDTHALSGAFLAKQLTRLADVISVQGDELLREAGIIIPARAVSCILLVGDEEHVSVADIAKALDRPHQLATQHIEASIDLGLLKRLNDPNDGRRKIVVLTAKGKVQYRRLRLRLREIEQAFLGLFAEIDCDLSAIAEKARLALGEKSLLKRIEANA